jgi:putative membrane-bound dehydrogenase-like protein
MKRQFACAALAITLWADHALAQLSPADAQLSFVTAEDVRIELVAAEPLVASPCALAFDQKGQLFVAENRGYPNTEKPPQGVVALLEDTDGDGRMDKRHVYADGLTYPNGVLAWRGGVIVTCAPDVLFLKDTDGDGRADLRRVLLTGFETSKSTQLRVNAPTLGPDGWIYLAAGLAGGMITCPEHPERAGLKMTADVRFHPDTLEVEHVDGKSQFGMAFDDLGRRFICMNRLPVQHVVLSSKMLARNPQLAFSETVQDCNERSVKTGLKGGGDGVKLFPISSNITTADSHAGSFSAACGIHIWQGEALGIDYRGSAFSCDPTGNLVHVDQLTLSDATFVAKPLFAARHARSHDPQPRLTDREFVASRDDWFRPVFLAPGPDGGLYIADMYRKVIEHPDYLPEEVRKRTDFESGKTMGRIWRVMSKKSAKVATVQEFDSANVSALVRAMDSPTGWAQNTASRLLFERRDPATVEALRAALLQNASSFVQYRRVRMLDALGAVDDARLAELLQARDVDVTRAAIELAVGRVPAGSAARQALFNLNPRSNGVWFTHLLALGGVDDWRAYAQFAEWSKLRGQDRWVRAAILSGIAGREEEFLTALYTQTGPSIATRLFADLRGLDNTPIARKIFQRAADDMKDGGLSPDDRLLVIRLLGRSTWEIAGNALTTAWRKADDDAARSAIAASLAALDTVRAAQVLLEPGTWPRYSPSLREAVLNALLSRRGKIEPLLLACESGEVPVSALNSTRRQILTKHADAAIRERAAKLFSQTEVSRAAALERAKAALALPPNAVHGREVFRQLCALCHRLDREGFAVGPDLLDMRNQTKENIVFHIVAPEAEVAPAFTAYTCETKDGRNLVGILTSETPTSVTLRQPGGAEENVLGTEVKTLTALPGSLMPSGLDAAMTPQDFSDLLAFLKGEN